MYYLNIKKRIFVSMLWNNKYKQKLTSQRFSSSFLLQGAFLLLLHHSEELNNKINYIKRLSRENRVCLPSHLESWYLKVIINHKWQIIWFQSHHDTWSNIFIVVRNILAVSSQIVPFANWIFFPIWICYQLKRWQNLPETVILQWK